MSRRGNSEGTITKRVDGRWEARISLSDGKRKSFYGKTRQEVAHRLAQARYEVDRGLPLPDERQTVGQYLATWFDGARLHLRPSSCRTYRMHVFVHLIPGLGQIPLTKLTVQQIQTFYARKHDGGLSLTTVHHMHKVLHQALKDAWRLGLVPRNVTDLMKAPRREHHEMVTLSEEQARHLLEVVAGERFEALFVLALTTGMREGELLALRWQDIDLDQAVLQVRVNLQEHGKSFTVAETKTAHSRRPIGVTKTAMAALRAHRVRQNEERLALGPAWDNTFDLVFPNTIGGLMRPEHFRREVFKRALAKAGLPAMRFHDLRHTAATILLSHGVNVKVVSEMLGHADVAITLRVYAHVIPHMQQAAVDVMDALFWRSA